MAVSLTKPTKMPGYTPEHIISEEESMPFRQREYTPKHFISEEESIQTLQTNEQAVQIEVKPTEQPLAVRDAEVCMSDLMEAIDLADTEIQEQFITTFYRDIKSKRKLLKKYLKFKAKGYLFDWKHLLLNSVVAVMAILGVIFLPELLLQSIWSVAGDGSAEGAQVLGGLINSLKPISTFSAVTVALAFSLWIGRRCMTGYYHSWSSPLTSMSHKDSDVAEFSRFVKLKYVMAKFAAFCKNNIEYVVMAIGVVVILTAAITTIYGLLNVGVAAILVIVGVAAILVIVAVIVYDRLNCR